LGIKQRTRSDEERGDKCTRVNLGKAQHIQVRRTCETRGERREEGGEGNYRRRGDKLKEEKQ
jgi:hypothetical protein